MAREDIRLEVIGDIESYARAVGKIPGVTEKEAEKAGKAFVRSQRRAQIKAVLEAEKAAKSAGDEWAKAHREAAQAAAKEAEEAAEKAKGDWVAAGGAAATGFAGAFTGMAAIIGSVGAYVEQLSTARLEMDALSRSTGIGLDTLSGIAEAARVSGKDFDTVTAGLEDFGEKMFDASRGSGAATEAFELMGFSQADLKSRLDDTDGVLRDSIAAYQAMEDGALKNTVGQQLWGDSSKELGAVLGDVPLDEFVERAEQMGTKVTPQNIESSRQWRATLSTLKGEMVATGNALVDGLDVTDRVEKVALAFVFLKNVIVESLTKAVSTVKSQFEFLGAVLTGDFAKASEVLREDLFDMREDFQEVGSAVMAATREYHDNQEAAKEVGKQTTKLGKDLGDLSEEQDKAREAAEKHAEAQAKLAERQAKAGTELRKTISQLSADQLSAEEKVLAARDANLAKIGETQAELVELLKSGVDVSEEIALSQIAANEAIARSERELAAIRADGVDEFAKRNEEAVAALSESIDTMNEKLDEHREARREAFEEGFELAIAFADLGLGLLDELNQRTQESAKAALDQQKNANREIRDERSALKQQLTDDLSEEERAAISSQIARLDAELAAGKERRKQRRTDALEAWRASKAIAISAVVFETAAAVMKAFSMFGPPPSPIGVGAASAAAATGLVQGAVIASEKPPQFHDGFDGSFPGFTGGPDERSAVLRQGEPVLNARAADNLGRENIRSLNGTGELGGGGGGRMGLFLESRAVGEVVVRTIDRGGRLRRKLRKGSRPSGQVSVFSASR